MILFCDIPGLIKLDWRCDCIFCKPILKSLPIWCKWLRRLELGVGKQLTVWVFMRSSLHPFTRTHHHSGGIIYISIKKAISRTNCPKMWGQEERNLKWMSISEFICLNLQGSIFFWLSLYPQSTHQVKMVFKLSQSDSGSCFSFWISFVVSTDLPHKI